MIVCGTGGGRATAELTWALILALLRTSRPPTGSCARAAGRTLPGTELAGSTLGLIGLGRLGSGSPAVAHGLRDGGARLVARTSTPSWPRARRRAVAKEELLRRSDVVSLHLRLSDRTRGLLGAAELGADEAERAPGQHLARPDRRRGGAGRGAGEGTIAGAGLDVYDEEPLPRDHPLRSAPNTVLTPHLGYVTDSTYQVFFADVVEDIEAWVAGAPLRVVEA